MKIVLIPNPLELDEDFIRSREHRTHGDSEISLTTNPENNIPDKFIILDILPPILYDDSPQIKVEIYSINILDNNLIIHTKQGNDITISMDIESIKFIKKLEDAIKEKLENPPIE